MTPFQLVVDGKIDYDASYESLYNMPVDIQFGDFTISPSPHGDGGTVLRVNRGSAPDNRGYNLTLSEGGEEIVRVGYGGADEISLSVGHETLTYDIASDIRIYTP